MASLSLSSCCPTGLSDPDSLVQIDSEEIERRVLEYARELYDEQEASLTPELMRSVEREVMLRIIDGHWVQHLTGMENLRQGIGLYAYGQRDPLVMYKKEGREKFDDLLARIQYDIVHTIYHVNMGGTGNDGKSRRAGPKSPNGGQSIMTRVMGNRSREPVTAGAQKVGRKRNSALAVAAKKYKRCHGT